MFKRYFFSLLCSLIVMFLSQCVNAQDNSQKTDDIVSIFSRLGTKQQTLSVELLNRATRIRYCKGNGSVAPDGKWCYYIDVMPLEVKLSIWYGYDGSHVETITKVITGEEYSAFKSALLSQGIRKVEPDENLLGLCGADEEEFVVSKGNNCLLTIGCSIGELRINRGKISDNFKKLLNAKQKQAINRLY